MYPSDEVPIGGGEGALAIKDGRLAGYSSTRSQYCMKSSEHDLASIIVRAQSAPAPPLAARASTTSSVRVPVILVEVLSSRCRSSNVVFFNVWLFSVHPRVMRWCLDNSCPARSP